MVKRILSIILLLNFFILSPVFEKNPQASGVVYDCVNFGTYTTEGTLAYALYLGGEVTFACSGTIISPRIDIEIDTIIDANGNNVVLSGNNTNSVFWVSEGKKLDLIGLKITQGKYSTGGGGIHNNGGIVNLSNCEIYGNESVNGAGIHNRNTATYVGQMTLVNTTVSDNIANGSGGATGGGIYNAGNMTLTDSTVTRNSATAPLYYTSSGGGIHNLKNSELAGAGTMVVIRSAVSDNVAGYGAGIYNMLGFLTIEDTIVSGNDATDNLYADGGGIRNYGINSVTLIKNCTITNNTALRYGGGLHAYSGTITIENSTISNNYAVSDGGGIASSVDAILTITNSTISDNISDTEGGGIIIFTGSAAITNSTLSGNSASLGGGIYNGAHLTLTHVTFSGNSASQGSSLYVANGPTSNTQIYNTIFVKGLTGPNCGESGIINYTTDNGYNLDNDGSCNLTNPTSFSNISDPGIDAALADNGGLTLTHALLSGSHAIDQIPSGINGCGNTILIDQRGVSRPQGGGCDIGAFELVPISIDEQPPVVSNVIATPNPSPPNTNITLTALVDDTSSGNSNVVSADYNIDAGEWLPMSATDSVFDSSQEAVTGTITIPNPGSYTVCVRGTDSSENISEPQCTNLSIVESPTNIIYVGNIDGTIKPGKRTSALTATVKVLDENGAPASSVNVRVQITNPAESGVVSELTAKTNRSGIATFKSSSAITSWKVCVISLTKKGFIYDPDANTETCETYTLP